MKNLVTVRTYSLYKGWTAVYTYKLMKEGKVKHTTIDGVKFIVLDDQEYQQVNCKNNG